MCTILLFLANDLVGAALQLLAPRLNKFIFFGHRFDRVQFH
jgi:hypothetical protein